MSIYKGLVEDIPQATLQGIPLGTAAVLSRQVKSKTLRQDPRVLAAAKKKPKQFTQAMQTIAPEMHVEGIVRKTIDFTESQWSVIESTYAKYQVIEGPVSFATFIEFLCSEISLSIGIIREVVP